MTEFENKLRNIKGKIGYIKSCLSRGPDYSWNPSREAVLNQEMVELRAMITTLDYEDQIDLFFAGAKELTKIINEKS